MAVRVVLVLLNILVLARKQSSSVYGLTSIVTGANGYIGRAVVHELLDRHDESSGEILCLVRPQRVASEQEYWKDWVGNGAVSTTIRVLPYDMLDEGATLAEALQSDASNTTNLRCVYHIASVFGPTENHKQTALDNVQGTEDLVRTLARMGNCKLVLTSSMAAVRGSGQEPSNGKFYTSKDWNTLSELGANWGASYQWSKAESERRAWELCRENNVPMISLCPSFVFGPPRGSSSSYSITLVGQWAKGESPVQSRLFVDIRDIAKAHVEAGMRESAVGKRFIVSTEARIPSREIACWLKEVCLQMKLSDPEKIHYDADFNGGAIPIGEKEVEAEQCLQKELGVSLHPVKDTIIDMAKVLLEVNT